MILKFLFAVVTAPHRAFNAKDFPRNFSLQSFLACIFRGMFYASFSRLKRSPTNAPF